MQRFCRTMRLAYSSLLSVRDDLLRLCFFFCPLEGSCNVRVRVVAIFVACGVKKRLQSIDVRMAKAAKAEKKPQY